MQQHDSENESILRDMRIRCPNIQCRHEWQYKGSMFFYATCPNCRHNVRLDRNKVESTPQSVQVRGQRQTAATSVE